MPRAIQRQESVLSAVQERPVRNRKIKQKGYEFEVLSKVQCSNPESGPTTTTTTTTTTSAITTTTAKPAPVVKSKTLSLAVPTPKQKRRHALFLGQASRSSSLYSSTPGKSSKSDLQGRKPGRPRRLPAAADSVLPDSAPSPQSTGTDLIPDPEQAIESAQAVKRRPGRPRKVRSPPRVAATLANFAPAIAQEPEKSGKSSRHLRAEQRAQQRAERDAVDKDAPVQPTLEIDAIAEHQKHPQRSSRSHTDDAKEDGQLSGPSIYTDNGRGDSLGQRKRRRLLVENDCDLETRAAATITHEAAIKNTEQMLSDQTVFGKADSPQDLNDSDHSSPFIRALQRRYNLATFPTHSYSSTSLANTSKVDNLRHQSSCDRARRNNDCASRMNRNSNLHHDGADDSQQPNLKAEDLLPDPMLAHVVWISQDNAWNQSREKHLRCSIGEWAASTTRAAKGNEAELWMWRLMIHFFKAMPHDLWRYGLRPHRGDCWATEGGIGPKPSAPACNLSYEFCLELSVLLCHPVWERDLMKLRFALQTAICSRVENHVFPVAGLDARVISSTKRITDSLADACNRLAPEKELELMCKIQSQYYHSGGPSSDKDIQWLVSRLSVHHRDGHATVSEEERLLFLLRTADIIALREALDSQESHGQAKWRPAIEYCRIFAETPVGKVLTSDLLHSSKQDVPVPADHLTLTRWKTECLIAERRERLIRDEAVRSGAMLFDIPRGDPQPYHVFTKGEFSEAQQRIVTGTVYLPDN